MASLTGRPYDLADFQARLTGKRQCCLALGGLQGHCTGSSDDNDHTQGADGSNNVAQQVIAHYSGRQDDENQAPKQGILASALTLRTNTHTTHLYLT